MSEEEILKILNSYTTDLFHSYKEDVILKAIRGLLDLYNKEKEKNKLLIEGKFREVADKNSYIKDNYISKDKIKEKMEELEDIRIENLGTQYYGTVEQCENKIEVLEELLKE